MRDILKWYAEDPETRCDLANARINERAATGVCEHDAVIFVDSFYTFTKTLLEKAMEVRKFTEEETERIEDCLAGLRILTEGNCCTREITDHGYIREYEDFIDAVRQKVMKRLTEIMKFD